jgi:hypothetical protein
MDVVVVDVVDDVVEVVVELVAGTVVVVVLLVPLLLLPVERTVVAVGPVAAGSGVVVGVVASGDCSGAGADWTCRSLYRGASPCRRRRTAATPSATVPRSPGRIGS